MGFFDIFKKKASPAQEQEKLSEEERPEGWDAITAAFECLYPGQPNPPHRAPKISRMYLLSEDAAAFDGVSAYDAGGHWHFVTYGLTELYAKENDDPEWSGFGYEFTFKLPKLSELPPLWAFDLLDAIGRQVWKGARFEAGHWIELGPLDGRPETPQTAAIVLRDPAFPQPLDTPHGKVEFLLLLGVEDAYRQQVQQAYEASEAGAGWEAPVVAQLRAENPDLVTQIRSVGEWGER